MLFFIFSIAITLSAATHVTQQTAYTEVDSYVTCRDYECQEDCMFFQKDAYGCATCECDWCEQKACSLECEEGFMLAQDASGMYCPMCACQEWFTNNNNNSITTKRDQMIDDSLTEENTALYTYLKDKAALHRLLAVDHPKLKTLLENLEKDLEKHMEESGILKAYLLAQNNGTYAKQFQNSYQEGTLNNSSNIEHGKILLLKEHQTLNEVHDRIDRMAEDITKNIEDARKEARDARDFQVPIKRIFRTNTGDGKQAK